jgi:hypothetical protein
MSDIAERGTALEEAVRHVQELVATERRLSERLIATGRECAALEAAASDATVSALLAGAEPDDEDRLAQVVLLQARERDTRRAVGASRDQRRDAIRAVYRAEAAERRARAAVLRTEADERQAKVDRLLDELQEWQGVRYAPPEGHPGGPGSPRLMRVPKTEALRVEADALDAEAAAWQDRQPVDGGQEFADDAEALVERACYANPMAIGPTEEAVRKWAAETVDHEGTRRRRFKPDMARYLQPDAPIHLRLQWAQGDVVATQSGVEPPSPREWYLLRRQAGRSVEEAAADLNIRVQMARQWEVRDDVAKNSAGAA